MQTGNFRKTLCTALFVVVSITTTAGQKISRADSATAIPTNLLLRIMRAEDERRWDLNVSVLLGAKYPITRRRAALALGRIGDERAVPTLIEVLKSDSDSDVRQMVAFALGEIESPSGADALISVLENTREQGEVRARAVEALGKIGAVLLSKAAASGDQTSLPKAEDKRLAKIRLAILDALRFESGRRSMPDHSSILFGLTAALRVRPEGAGPVIIRFLGYTDSRIVTDALNCMPGLRLKDGSDQVRQSLENGDAIVRANAARVLGATEDKQSFDALLDRALHDDDLRARVSAIRALGSLKDARAAEPLVERGQSLLKLMTTRGRVYIDTRSELIEIVSALGRTTPRERNNVVVNFLVATRDELNHSPEVEIALARISPVVYATVFWHQAVFHHRIPESVHELSWQIAASHAQGLSETANSPQASISKDESRGELFKLLLLSAKPHPFAVPAILQAYAVFKPGDLSEVLRKYLIGQDVIIRATAAELLGEQPPDEANARALIEALLLAFRDKDLNDAALSILDALAKEKSAAANDAIKMALDSSDHLIRRRAVALLKANGVGDFSNRIGTVKTRNTDADYLRAIARIGRKVTATVVTSKGAFTIEFLTEEAPLTVDNFVQLARKGYFNGQTVPRVVPNFVIQTGDPRGDQNGGPGYQIRCEINEVPYERGAVGMALSGKDAGGSQWFVTPSPQPHLDGGYTVFGHVIRGMDVVDNIARGDTIRRVIVNER